MASENPVDSGSVEFRPGVVLRLSNRKPSFRHLAEWTRQAGLHFGMSNDLLFRMDLCLQEALANIITHAYEAEPEQHVYFNCDQEAGGGLWVVLIDDGPAFDPLQAELPKAPHSIEDFPVGGQGVQLIRKMSSEIYYERRDEQNRLTIVFEEDHE